MATLFTGGSVFDGHRHLPDHGLLVDGGDGRGGRWIPVVSTRSTGATTRSSTWPAAWCRPGFTDAHVPPDPGRARADCSAT